MNTLSGPRIVVIDEAMSSEFGAYAVKDCREKGFPCLPDPDNPVLSIRYLAEEWAQLSGDKAFADMGNRAEALELVVCTLNRHRCIRMADFQRVVSDEEGAT